MPAEEAKGKLTSYTVFTIHHFRLHWKMNCSWNYRRLSFVLKFSVDFPWPNYIYTKKKKQKKKHWYESAVHIYLVHYNTFFNRKYQETITSVYL